MFLARWLLFSLIVVLTGCAGKSVISSGSNCISQLENLIDKQNTKRESFAALMRVKMSRDGKIDDFRVELFSQGDNQLSIYVRGFLGKSILKTVLIDDSLVVFFPSQNSYFTGVRGDIESGKLQETNHIIECFLTLLSGSAVIPDTSLWNYSCSLSGSRFVVIQQDRRFKCGLKTHFRYDVEHFPYIKLERIELTSDNEKLKANLKLQTIKFNKAIPPEKLRLIPPAGSRQLTKDEFVEMLVEVR